MVTPICCVTSTVALPDLVESAADVAVTVTNAGSGACDGAVYRPPAVIVPQVDPTHPVPLNPQVTAVLLEPVTVAVNCWRAPTLSDGLLGETVTTMLFGATIVTGVEPVIDPFESEVAVTVTIFGLGAVAGAV
jgi:hypothetical protein